ncbi:hypothetical protein GCM10009839_14940 [Catenulispora yoronensis]|uniref:TadE-like domain-containing protein n=1 Tax=Catenulispora yoronensis TaxID=450799 RepID=A0ABN2TTW5_9ACTN
MRLRRWSGPGAVEDGSATLEAVIIAPIIIVLVTFAVVLGRVANFHESVEQAAQAAARSGSMSRDAALAEANADKTWHNLVTDGTVSGLPTNGLECTDAGGVPDSTAFKTVPGTPQSVAVNDASGSTRTMFAFRAVCTLDTKWLLGMFSTPITVQVTAYSPLDPYRCDGTGGC